MNNLDPLARALWTGRSYAAEIDSDFFTMFDDHVNMMAKAHLMRSVLQSLALGGRIAGFEIIDEYLAYGRAEMVSTTTGQHYLLKARSALPFQVTTQVVLFGSDQPVGSNPLKLLLYDFSDAGLALATISADQRQLNGRRQIVLLDDEVSDAGLWPPHVPPGSGPFDQGAPDSFVDLSDGVHITQQIDT